jgi:hypothetical protein
MKTSLHALWAASVVLLGGCATLPPSTIKRGTDELNASTARMQARQQAEQFSRDAQTQSEMRSGK